MDLEKLAIIAKVASVSGIACIGGVEGVKAVHSAAHSIAQPFEEPLGVIGSGSIEYGLPAVCGIAAAYFIYTAIKATSTYVVLGGAEAWLDKKYPKKD